MQELGRLNESVSLWRNLQSQVDSLLELTDLALEEGDDSFQDQLEAETEQLGNTLA